MIPAEAPDRTDPRREDATPSRVAAVVDRVVRSYTDRWGVVATLTLIGLLILPPPGTPTATSLLVGLGLLSVPWLRQDWRLWAVLTAITAFGVLRQPLLDLDNHHFLELYWLGSVTLACLTDHPLRALGRTARLLVGLVFLFATLWKLLSPDFADGSVMTYLMVADGNAAEVMHVTGLQDSEVLESNRQLIADQRGGHTQPEAIELHVSAAAARLAPVMTVLTVVIEAAVALAFLLPFRGKWQWLREITLYAFVFSTYPLVPVVAFAWLLLTMGLACSALRMHRATVVYLVAFTAVGALGSRAALLELFSLA